MNFLRMFHALFHRQLGETVYTFLVVGPPLSSLRLLVAPLRFRPPLSSGVRFLCAAPRCVPIVPERYSGDILDRIT